MDRNTKPCEHAKALPIAQCSILSNFDTIWCGIKLIARKSKLVENWVDTNSLMGPNFDIYYN